MPSLSLRQLHPMRTDSSASTISSGSSAAGLSIVSSSSLSSSPGALLSRLGRSSSLGGMSVVVENQKPYYTVGDSLSGAVILTPKNNTEFTEMFIALEGTAKTWNESPGVGSRVDAKDTFLEMSSPVQEDDYPSPRIFRAGVTYKFSFLFVLPEHLLESQCDRVVCHRHLPSTLGDPNMPFELDDCSPDMARITYRIIGKVFHAKDNGSRKYVPYTASTPIAVIAAYTPDIRNIPHNHCKDQELSLADGGFTRFYRTAKTLKKGIIGRSTIGNLTLEASVLKPFVYLKNQSVPLLLALSYFHLANAKKSDIPKVESVSVKLRVYTYFTTVPITYMPHPKSRAVDPQLGLYQESFTIANYSFTAPTSSRPEWAQESDTHYSFNATVPLTQPKQRALVPNFWSCLIGRQYEAEVTVKLSGAGPGTIGLKIPIEVMTDKIAANMTVSEDKMMAF
ncbi:hypothetical protein V1520DRAFT_379599 [Lipomyces starkeyi]|uniref:Arrestin-like N-terminal domain-containing protein n=1 Tax=Lipomyces starkeyi NRRL Y-11557 TaxID=675824 RepID=A0A1E3Q5T3_LIPST|nr:hypothetical protein LIPSTDRAFT_3397 [Lipomyces starkeyi NRRL Y-11557]